MPKQVDIALADAHRSFARGTIDLHVHVRPPPLPLTRNYAPRRFRMMVCSIIQPHLNRLLHLHGRKQPMESHEGKLWHIYLVTRFDYIPYSSASRSPEIHPPEESTSLRPPHRLRHVQTCGLATAVAQLCCYTRGLVSIERGQSSNYRNPTPKLLKPRDILSHDSQNFPTNSIPFVRHVEI